MSTTLPTRAGITRFARSFALANAWDWDLSTYIDLSSLGKSRMSSSQAKRIIDKRD